MPFYGIGGSDTACWCTLFSDLPGVCRLCHAPVPCHVALSQHMCLVDVRRLIVCAACDTLFTKPSPCTGAGAVAQAKRLATPYS
jgi:hypothetical protein